MPDPQSPTVDETRAPDPFPDVLPAGVVLWRGRIGAESNASFTTVEPATLRGGAYWCRRYRREDGGVAGDDRSFFDPAKVNWPSYYAALRSQPAPVPPTESEEPKVGETWHSDTYDRSWGPLRVERFYPDGLICCRGTGGTFIGDTGSFHREDLTRRLPAPPATEAKGNGWICAECNAACGGPTDRCAGCGMARGAKSRTDAELNAETLGAKLDFPNTKFPASKPDPYAEHRAYLGGDPVDHSPAKRKAFVADTLRDLDRPLSPPRYPSRSYACVGVMGGGEGVKRREAVTSHPASWPSCGDEEP